MLFPLPFLRTHPRFCSRTSNFAVDGNGRRRWAHGWGLSLTVRRLRIKSQFRQIGVRRRSPAPFGLVQQRSFSTFYMILLYCINTMLSKLLLQRANRVPRIRGYCCTRIIHCTRIISPLSVSAERPREYSLLTVCNRPSWSLGPGHNNNNNYNTRLRRISRSTTAVIIIIITC